jgi:hypothetical protein
MNRESTPSVSVKKVILGCGAVCTNEDVLDLLTLFWTWMPPRRLLSSVAPLHEEQWSRAASRCCCPLRSLRKADGVVLLACELVRTERTHALNARTTSLLGTLPCNSTQCHAKPRALQKLHAWEGSDREPHASGHGVLTSPATVVCCIGDARNPN